jgi:sugar-specific transcriptional regulator TrmB
MEWRELLGAMGRFGFQDREASLYLLLLRRGRATARELTREAEVDRVIVYRTLDSMRQRGLVQVTAERPRRYLALPPTLLFERSLTERRRVLEEDVALARELGRNLPQITQELVAGAPRFQLITGAPAAYPILREMIGRAERELCVMLTYRSLRASMEVGTFQPLGEFARRGGAIRLLLENDPRLPLALRRFDGARRRYPKLEVRVASPQRARLTVVDQRESLVFVVPETGRDHVEEIALWTDTLDFARAQQSFFEAVWSTAAPLPVGPPPRGGHRRPGGPAPIPPRRRRASRPPTPA